MSRIYIIFYVLLLGNISFAEVFHLQPGEDAQQRIQEAMILAKPGDTIQLDEGERIPKDLSKEGIEKMILSNAKISQLTNEKSVKKVIIVPEKIINIVVN